MIRDVAVMIEPYMPSTAKKIFSFFGSCEGWTWKDLSGFTGLDSVENVSLLFSKLDDELVSTLKLRYSGTQEEREKETPAKENKKEVTDNAIENESIAHQFERRVTLKVARITQVEKHPNGDLLYILHLDDGSPDGRTIVSSIVPYYKAEDLLTTFLQEPFSGLRDRERLRRSRPTSSLTISSQCRFIQRMAG